MRVYKQYFSSFGVSYTITYFVLSSLFAGGLAVQSLWLKWWATAAPTNDAKLGYYAGVVAVVIGVLDELENEVSWLAIQLLGQPAMRSDHVHTPKAALVARTSSEHS